MWGIEMPWFEANGRGSALPAPELPVVDWHADPRRKAERIMCVVCHACRWLDPEKPPRCLYGGPFYGPLPP